MTKSKICAALFTFAALASWWSLPATAACSGASPTRVAASPARNDVNDCVTAAASGDTIIVPAGSANWTSTINVAKDVAIIGAGAGKTNITGSINCFTLNSANQIRLSGFSFTDCTYSVSGNPSGAGFIRIDHNSFSSTSLRENAINGGATSPMRHPSVLIDNNKFVNYRTNVAGTAGLLSEGNWQHQLWAQPQPKGDATGVIYLEDNVFEGTGSVHQNYIDGSYGARYVSRFNTVRGYTYAEVHSVQGENRAVHWWEFYRNTIERLNGVNHVFVYYIRGGSGMSWGNRISSDHSVSSHTINNVRSCRDVGGTAGKCNGSSSWDQNGSGQSGWACRDQIGRGSDTATWSPGSAFTQPTNGAYFWDNLKGASAQFGVTVDAGEPCPGGDLNSTHLVQNRDWYTQNTSFNGTSGVGVGTLSNRPTSCTTGVAYWATDQGEWNSRNPGPDGQLYKCTAPNTWSLYYIPYTYPHPLQGGSSAQDPLSAPTGLSAAVQ